ncbi:FAD-dependent oxidoreductase [Agrobacterium vitis]|nr:MULTISPECIES: FAD-dependent oxidoreductase [Rhizobium/Agrobacterium group]MCF1464720.1 FAD-dependent oxidoreductase [Allorhizobium ampelinum]MVA52770.1 FAD-dependent oxidoreductase [Agrobacterium vitis]
MDSRLPPGWPRSERSFPGGVSGGRLLGQRHGFVEVSEHATGQSVAIIGAGIIGTALASRLSCRGYRVTLFDAGAPGERGPSRGNAGHIAGSDIFPISGPNIALAALKMLMRRNGPLKIDPSHIPKLLPWLSAFVRTGKGQAFDTATRSISLLCDGAVDATEKLFAEAGLGHLFQRVPALYVYDSVQSMDASRNGWARKAAAGHPYRFVTADEVKALEPELAPGFAGGVLSLDWGQVTEPHDVVLGFFEAALARGAIFHSLQVETIEANDRGILLTAGGKAHSFDRAVIAAGVWSRTLAAQLGDTLPVEAEGGYNTTFPEPAIGVTHPIVFSDRGIVSTSLRTGLRIGGWAEYAGIAAKAEPAYFDRIETISRSLFPRLNISNGVHWAGRRPSMPDSVPVISRTTRHPQIFYATGHGHYGLSWAARTTEILLQLMEGSNQAAKPFSIGRFTNKTA